MNRLAGVFTLLVAAGKAEFLRRAQSSIDIDWRIPSEPYDPITAEVGTILNFKWSGPHNLVLHPSGSCDTAGAVVIAGFSLRGDVDYTVEADAGSTLFLACDIGSHCAQDMYVEVTVVPAADAPVSPAPVVPATDAPVTPAPVEPAPSPPGGGFCFSGATLVETRDRGSLRMDQLQIGDYVLVDESKTYEQIYSFGHFDQKSVVAAEFLEIRTVTSSGIEMTSDHFIFIEGNKAVPASSISVGDKVMLASGETDAVVSIKKVSRNGIFAPFTPSGTIVTNGIKSSSFATIQDSRRVSLSGIEIPITYHQLGVIFESPHRLVCRYFNCALYETYNEEGMSNWVEMPMKAFQWMVQQHAVVSGILFLCIFAAFCLMNLLEMAVLKPSFFTFLLSATIVVVHYYRRTKKVV